MIFGFVIVSAIAYQRADIWYLLTRLIGAVGGGVALWLVAVVGSAVLRKKAMGGGDIKLMVLNGLFLGAWPEQAMVIAFSALSGAIVGTILIVSGVKSRQSPIPYGPIPFGCGCACSTVGRWPLADVFTTRGVVLIVGGICNPDQAHAVRRSHKTRASEGGGGSVSYSV